MALRIRGRRHADRSQGVQFIPQVWVVGTDGKIRWNFDTEGSLDAAIEDALSSSSAQVADRSTAAERPAMTSVSGENITSVLQESRVFPPPAEFARRPTSRAKTNTTGCGTGRRTTRPASGARWPPTCTGSASGTRSSTAPCPTRSGSSAGKSTRRTTASTGTCRRGGRTRPPSSGRASRATRACCGIRICTARSAASPTS